MSLSLTNRRAALLCLGGWVIELVGQQRRWMGWVGRRDDDDDDKRMKTILVVSLQR